MGKFSGQMIRERERVLTPKAYGSERTPAPITVFTRLNIEAGKEAKPVSLEERETRKGELVT